MRRLWKFASSLRGLIDSSSKKERIEASLSPPNRKLSPFEWKMRDAGTIVRFLSPEDEVEDEDEVESLKDEVEFCKGVSWSHWCGVSCHTRLLLQFFFYTSLAFTKI